MKEWMELRPKYTTDPVGWTRELREGRERWIRFEAPEWAFTIEAYRHLYDRYSTKVPARELYPDGRETEASMGRRATAAYTLGLAETGTSWKESPYTYAALRRQLQPLEKREERELRERISVEKFHSQAPEMLKSMGIGERLVEVLGDPTHTRETLLVSRWLTEGRRWAFILSGVGGAGKSVALAMALQHYCRERVPTETHVELQWRPTKGRYVLAGDLTSGVAFGSEGEDRVRRFSNYELLCLDDLGTETLTDVGRDMLFRILDARYRGARSRMTLISTNLSWDELVQRYGERFSRRFDKARDEGAAFLPVNQAFVKETP
jgi:DNA replication protein DnaC